MAKHLRGKRLFAKKGLIFRGTVNNLNLKENMDDVIREEDRELDPEAALGPADDVLAEDILGGVGGDGLTDDDDLPVEDEYGE